MHQYLIINDVNNGAIWGRFSGVCCTSFQNFEDAWRSYGTDEDILFVFKDSWCPLRCPEASLLAPGERSSIRNSPGRGDRRILTSGCSRIWSSSLSNCMNSRVVEWKLNGCGESWEKRNFWDKMCTFNVSRLLLGALPLHIYKLFFFFFLRLLRILSTGNDVFLSVSGNKRGQGQWAGSWLCLFFNHAREPFGSRLFSYSPRFYFYFLYLYLHYSFESIHHYLKWKRRHKCAFINLLTHLACEQTGYFELQIYF